MLNVGIDLGTTNTVVAFNDKHTGAPVILQFDNESSLPSVVAYKKDRRGNEICLTGSAAVNEGEVHPERMIASAKRNMCRRSYIYPDDYEERKLDIPHKVTPTDVAAELIKRIKRELIEQGFARENERICAVISVPAKFDELGRNNTKTAGANGGLDVISLIPEPTAAAYYYARNHIEDRTRLFVFDFGGGTLDFTIMDYDRSRNLIINESNFDNCAYDPITVGGDKEVGGDDIDKAILDYIIKYVQDDINIDLSTYRSFIDTLRKCRFMISENESNENLYNRIIGRLKGKAVRAKHDLSERDDTIIYVDVELLFKTIPELENTEIGNYSIYCGISREKFETQIFTEVARKITKAFADIFTEGSNRHTGEAVSSQSINKILMVGGSSNIPVVKKLVRQALQNNDIISNEPATAIAKGALLYANMLDECIKRTDSITITHLSEQEFLNRRNNVASPVQARNSGRPAPFRPSRPAPAENNNNNNNNERRFLPPPPIHILSSDFGIATFDRNNNEVFDCLTKEGTSCPTAKTKKKYKVYVYPNGEVAPYVIIKVYSRERSEHSANLNKCKLMFEYKYSDYDPQNQDTEILITFQHMHDGTLVATAKNLAYENGTEVNLKDKP